MKKGFTLVELIIVVGILSIIMLVISVPVSNVIKYQRDSQTSDNMRDNLQFVINKMEKELKTASNVYVDGGDLNFKDQFGGSVKYSLINNEIIKNDSINITDKNIFKVNSLNFSKNTSNLVTISIKSESLDNKDSITMQTSVFPLNDDRVVQNNLILNLDAGNSASYPGTGTTWTDLSRNGNNGTLINVGYDSGNRGSLIFNGSNNYVSTSLSPSVSFTWSAWYKTNVVNDGVYRNIIASTSMTAIPYMIMLLDDNTNYMGFWASDTLTSGPSLNMGPISTDTWYFATFVREGNNITNGYKTYMNDSFKGVANTGIWSSSELIRLGGRIDMTQYLKGNIGQVLIYDRALTLEEIQQNYEATKERFGY